MVKNCVFFRRAGSSTPNRCSPEPWSWKRGSFCYFLSAEGVPTDTASLNVAHLPSKCSSGCTTVAESQSLRPIFPKIADSSGRPQGGGRSAAPIYQPHQPYYNTINTANTIKPTVDKEKLVYQLIVKENVTYINHKILWILTGVMLSGSSNLVNPSIPKMEVLDACF